jgi:hypothetical protein
MLPEAGSIHAANHVPAATTGNDAARRVPGRMRAWRWTRLGLIIAVVVTAVSVSDNAIGMAPLGQAVVYTPTVTGPFSTPGSKATSRSGARSAGSP